MGTTQTDRLSGASSTSDASSDVNAIEDVTGTGLLARTAENTWALRTLTAPAAGMTVTNGAGVAGNPTLVLANDLAALEAMSGTGLAVHTGTSTWTERTIAVSGTGLAISNATGVAGNPTITITPSAVVGAVGTIPSAAAQADQETATSTTTYVSPGRQQFHPGHPKCWAYVTVSAGTPTLRTSYNITSITDTATGKLTITIATDFADALWTALALGECVTTALAAIDVTTKAAGTVLLESIALGGSIADPVAWNFMGLGDQ